MTYGFLVQKNHAQAAKEMLSSQGLLDPTKQPLAGEDVITFPIKKAELSSLPSGALYGGKIITCKFISYPHRMKSFREELQSLLGRERATESISGFDIVGDIAILEIPPSLKKEEQKIASLLLSVHPALKTIVKKGSIHLGVYRIQRLKHLAGEKKWETIHRENNVQIKLNINKAYFSPRLAEERKRIASAVKSGEKVLVLFSGVGVYPLVIAKNSPAAWVYGVELNPIAHGYAVENQKINHVKNITFLCADAHRIRRNTSFNHFDRIVMPLPKDAAGFFPRALKVAKKGTIFHFYDFYKEEDLPKKPREKISLLCKESGIKCKFLKIAQCGKYAPHISRVCIDFKLLSSP